MRQISSFFCLLLLLLSGRGPAFSQSIKEQEDKKVRLEKEIAILDKQLESNAARSKNAATALDMVQAKIETRNKLVAESDKQITSLNGQINTKQREINLLQRRLDTLSTYYAKLIRSAYKTRDAKIWYMYILASENLGQAFRRVGYLRNLSSQMNQQAEKIQQTQAELEDSKARLQGLRDEANVLKNQRLNEVEKLKEEEQQSKKLVGQLNREKSKYQKELDAKRKQVEALNREIAKLIKGETSSSKKSGEVDYALDSEFTKNMGKLPWPAEGPVVEKYGQRYHPVFTNVKLPFNNGVTIALSPGAEVHAVFDGTVKQIAVIPGYNRCILIQHGNYFSMYCKIGDVAVKAGDKVKTGQMIGKVDTIDGVTQLHFQIWQGTTPQNPENWLR